ncbi:MAG TPA: cell division protein FtsL [Candidatus Polarisedimenticolaceae bacterium]|nr:cell division protein FtsL [Candidatus Polarisedimenticolaceae bacterium]
MGPQASEHVRRWRNQSIHREVDKRHARWVWTVALGLAVAGIPFIVYLLQTMSYVQASYAIENIRASEARLDERERRLRIDKASLESLPSVESRAVRDLGLEHPSPSRVVVVAPGELPAARPR